MRQTREPHTCLSGKSGREVEDELARLDLVESVYTVRDRVCDGCGRVVGTAEILIEDLRDLQQRTA